jgi:hypothetical protein
MNSTRAGAERAALAFDEAIGSMLGMTLDSEFDRDRVEIIVHQLQMLRRYAIGIIDSVCPINAERLIHLPEIPAPEPTEDVPELATWAAFSGFIKET